MKLYSKNISSMADLERERRRLLKEKNLIEDEELFSVGDIVSEAGNLGIGIVANRLPLVSGIVARLLPFAGRFSAPLAGIVQGWLSSKADSVPGNLPNAEIPQNESRVKKVLMSAAREFIGSYLKWKAVELSYKGLTLIIKKQRKKHRKHKSAGV